MFGFGRKDREGVRLFHICLMWQPDSHIRMSYADCVVKTTVYPSSPDFWDMLKKYVCDTFGIKHPIDKITILSLTRID